MLRLVLLLLSLAGSFWTSTHSKTGGGWDPDGQTPPPAGDWGGGWDPDGLNASTPPATPTGDLHGNLDPNG